MNANPGKPLSPEHDEVEKYERSPGASNEEPQNEISVTISAPDSIDISLVDASSLLDYEIWGGLSSILLSILSGFFVALVQEKDPKIFAILKLISILLLAFFAFAVFMSISKRRKMKRSKKIMNLQTSKGRIRRT